MTVLVIAQLKFKDVEKYRKYQAGFPAVFATGKGRVLCADEAPIAMQGNWSPDKIVVMEFPTEQDARELLDGHAYRAISVDREAGAETMSIMAKAF